MAAFLLFSFQYHLKETITPLLFPINQYVEDRWLCEPGKPSDQQFSLWGKFN